MKDVLELVPENAGLEIHGPFQQYKASINGYLVPNLDVRDFGGEVLHLHLDNRFGADVDREHASEVVWLIANAIAIGAGYSHFGEGAAPINRFACKISGITLESTEQVDESGADTLPS